MPFTQPYAGTQIGLDGKRRPIGEAFDPEPDPVGPAVLDLETREYVVVEASDPDEDTPVEEE